MKKILFLLILITSNAYAFGSDGCQENTVFLSQFDNTTNGSTAFSEEDCDGNGKKTLTANGNVSMDTSRAYFGPSSAGFDGNGDYIGTFTLGSTIGTGDFTVDFWVNFADLGSNRWFQTMTDSIFNEFDIGYQTSAGGIRVYLNDVNYTFAWSPSINVWYHVLVSRQSGNLRVFVNGSQIGTTQTATDSVVNEAMKIGSERSANYMFGNLDGYRIVVGKALRTENFNPPTTPYCSGCEMAEME